MNTSFSFSAMISSGWATFKKNWKFIILAGLATLIIEALFQVINHNLREHIFIMLLAGIVMILVEIIISVSWTKVYLSLTRTGSASWKTFETNSKTWLRTIKVTIWMYLYMLYYTILAILPFIILAIIGALIHIKAFLAIAVILGYIVFIIIVCYIAIRYQFMYYVMLDNPELRSKAVFKKAGDITKGSLLQLLGFAIVLGFYNLLGLICLVVGLAVTIPVSKLAHAKVYDFLKEKASHAHPEHSQEHSHQN